MVGFYPTTPASKAILERTDRWLAERPDAPAALRRIRTESRAGVARALRAQARDAQQP